MLASSLFSSIRQKHDKSLRPARSPSRHKQASPFLLIDFKIAVIRYKYIVTGKGIPYDLDDELTAIRHYYANRTG